MTDSGLVLAYDDEAGFGTVRADDGRDFFFHCTAVADGSRTIAEGTSVVFDVVAGRRGQWEAAALRPT